MIRDILGKNHYPVCLINKLFYKYIDGKVDNNCDIDVDKRTFKYRTFPNVCNLTDRIMKCIRKFDQNIQICPKNIKTVRDLHSNVKAKVEIIKLTNCIYCICCMDCDGEYWGMTQQRVGKRLDQHLGDIELLHKMREDCGIGKPYDFKKDIEEMLDIELKKESKKQENQSVATNEKTKRTRKKKSEETRLDKIKKLAKQYEKSGLVNHHACTGHRIDFRNTKVVEKESSRSKLEILEVLHIKTNSNNINKKEDLAKIRNNYDGVLTKIRKKNDRKRVFQKDKRRQK
jgi:hypothetical protein